jgi:hypothetical protein
LITLWPPAQIDSASIGILEAVWYRKYELARNIYDARNRVPYGMSLYASVATTVVT